MHPTRAESALAAGLGGTVGLAAALAWATTGAAGAAVIAVAVGVIDRGVAEVGR